MTDGIAVVLIILGIGLFCTSMGSLITQARVKALEDKVKELEKVIATRL